ncbi:MAG: protoglobin domain-containing protein, partial [Isosphaeraceae bacterium]
SYLNWTNDDATRIATAAPLLETCFQRLVDDFYAEIERHPGARKVITGGQPQIERLKGTLIQWVQFRYDCSSR